MIVISSKWTLFDKLSHACQRRILNDLNLVWEVGSSTFIQLLSNYDEPCKLLLAFDGKTIVGWCGWFFQHCRWMNMRQFYVHPTYRRKGIGTALARKSIELLGDDIKGETWNTVSERFFESLKRAA